MVAANSSMPDPDLAAEVSHLAESGVLHALPFPLLLSIMDAIESREPYVRSRTRSVAAYAVATAREMRLPADQVEHVRLGAILCNLGMLRIPEAILQKREALTAEEQARVRHHPLRSAEMLSGVPELEPVIPIVLHHHEAGAAAATRLASAASASRSARGSSASARPTMRSPASAPTAPPTPRRKH